MADITSHLLKVMPPTYRVVPVAKWVLHFSPTPLHEDVTHD